MAAATQPAQSPVSLRPVRDEDLKHLFAYQREPEALRRAPLISREQPEFDAHWARIRSDPQMRLRTIVVDGEVAGSIGSFLREGERQVGYWLGQAWWGRGIATAALKAFVDESPERPLFAYIASGNVSSVRVAEKCGFAHVRTLAPTPASPVEELILQLS